MLLCKLDGSSFYWMVTVYVVQYTIMLVPIVAEVYIVKCTEEFSFVNKYKQLLDGVSSNMKFCDLPNSMLFYCNLPG